MIAVFFYTTIPYIYKADCSGNTLWHVV